jgi:hypothetical protein
MTRRFNQTSAVHFSLTSAYAIPSFAAPVKAPGSFMSAADGALHAAMAKHSPALVVHLLIKGIFFPIGVDLMHHCRVVGQLSQ